MRTTWARSAYRLPLSQLAGWMDRSWQWCRLALGHGSAGLAAALERARQRRALARLDDRLLRDLGLPPHLMQRELSKWFWQP